MAKPSDTFEWATDANHDDPGKGWDGQPTRVAPSSGKQQAGFLPDEAVPAERLNFLHGVTGEWIEYLEGRPEADRGVVPAAALIRGAPGWDVTSFGDDWVVSIADGLDGTFDLSPYIPEDAALAGVDIYVNPGAARLTVGDRIRARLVLRTMDWTLGGSLTGASISGADERTDGTGFAQIVSVNPTTPVVLSNASDFTKQVALIVDSGHDGATNVDRLDAIRIRFA